MLTLLLKICYFLGFSQTLNSKKKCSYESDSVGVKNFRKTGSLVSWVQICVTFRNVVKIIWLARYYALIIHAFLLWESLISSEKLRFSKSRACAWNWIPKFEWFRVKYENFGFFRKKVGVWGLGPRADRRLDRSRSAFPRTTTHFFNFFRLYL